MQYREQQKQQIATLLLSTPHVYVCTSICCECVQDTPDTISDLMLTGHTHNLCKAPLIRTLDADGRSSRVQTELVLVSYTSWTSCTDGLDAHCLTLTPVAYCYKTRSCRAIICLMPRSEAPHLPDACKVGARCDVDRLGGFGCSVPKGWRSLQGSVTVHVYRKVALLFQMSRNGTQT